jgi:hypothetical protein
VLSERLAIKVQILDESIRAITFEEGQRALIEGRITRFFSLMRWLDDLAIEQEFHRVPRWFNC